MAEKYIYIELTKKWGGFKVGDVVRFGKSKGEGRIKAGEGVVVKKQRAVNDPPAARPTPKAETATAKPPAETADNPPVIDAKAKAEAKAEAEAEAKAKAEAVAKAKAEAEAKAKAKAGAKKDKDKKSKREL